MKRTVSVLIIMAMLLASVLALIPASAATGTAINNASDFASMVPDGTYYLASNIELLESYPNRFGGTLDGNGKTITLKGAEGVFQEIDGGTVKNLTIAGQVVVTNKDIAGLAKYANGTFENVVNKAKITVNGENDNKPFTGKAAGLVAVVNGDNANTPKPSTFTNCKNEGAIEIKAKGGDIATGTGCNHHVGGLIGRTESRAPIVLSGCSNTGAISDTQEGLIGGGLIGSIYRAKMTLTNCTNNAAISLNVTVAAGGTHEGIGGMIGQTGWDYTNEDGFGGYLKMYNCKNDANGDLSITGESSGASYGMGGMIGRCLTPVDVTVSGCINSGDISHAKPSGWTAAGGIIGSLMTSGMAWEGTKVSNQRIVNCTNNGKITCGKAAGIVGGQWQFTAEDAKTVIEYCVNNGAINATESGAGIVGPMGQNGGDEKFSDLTIANCKNTATVTSGKNAAGILLSVTTMGNKYNPKITDCANTGAINAQGGWAAGIIGQVDTNSNKFQITGCANTGTLTATGSKAGIAGNVAGATINDCFYSNGTGSGTNDATAASNKVNSIKTSVVDTSAIDSLIPLTQGLIESDYTSNSISAMKTALNAAKSVLNNYKNATANDVTTAANNLKTAIDGLTFKQTDTAAIDAKIAEAKALNKDDWTSISFIRVTNALKAAEEAAKSVRQSEVDAALAELESAMSKLAESSKKNNSGDSSSNDDNNDASNGDANNGGANTNSGNTAETNAATDAKKDDAKKDDDKKGGCGSAITATAVVLSTVLALGAGVVFKKKED